MMIRDRQVHWDNEIFGGLREVAIKRDGYKCTECGITREQHYDKYGIDLSVHHINGLGSTSPIKDNRLENLQTVCSHCHPSKDGLRAVKMFTIDGKFIREFTSIQSVEDETGISAGCVTQQLGGDLIQTHGYIFKYVDETIVRVKRPKGKHKKHEVTTDKTVTRICSICKRQLNLIKYFFIDEYSTLGYSRRCRECYNKGRRVSALRAEQREKVNKI